MHFWINKGSQGGRGANGRYVPPSISSGSRRKQLCVDIHVKPMVTPVHRFLPMEGHASASPTHHSSVAGVRSSRFPPIVEERDTPHVTRQDTHRRRRRRLTNTSTPTSSTDLLCVNFVKLLLLCLVIGSFYVIKYNISHLNNSSEQRQGSMPFIIIIVALVLLLLKIGLKVCKELRRETAASGQSLSIDSDEAPPPPFVGVVAESPPPMTIPDAEMPPPPYSVAVTLPTHNDRIVQDSPPPSYEKAVT